MNTQDLRNMILNELADLQAGKTTNAKASTVARLAKAAISSRQLEVSLARFELETGKKPGAVEL